MKEEKRKEEKKRHKTALEKLEMLYFRI